MSKRLPFLACALAVAAAACSTIPNPTVEQGSGVRFVPQVADFVDDAGLGNQVVTNADGVPFLSYWIFPSPPVNGITVQRPIGAPYIRTLAAGTTPSQDGGAVGVASLAGNGIWTRGAAAQVQDTPTGIVVPYGPATDPNLIGATAANTNGTSMAIDASGNMDVVWTGRNGVYYASAPSTGGFQVERLYNYGFSLTLAGPISRPSIAVDASGAPWVAYTVVANGVEVRVATKRKNTWSTTTVAHWKQCNGCPQPRAAKIVMTPRGPMVVYVDTSTNRLNVAQLVKGKWTSGPVVKGTAEDGVNATVGKDGKVYVTYYGDGGIDLATLSGSTWTVSRVAAAAPPAPPSPIPVASPSASGSGSASGSASASASASPVTVTPRPSGGNFEPTTGVAVDDSGALYLAWYDGTGDHVLLAKDVGGKIQMIQTQDTDGGAYPSVAVTSDGSKVYLAWYGQVSNDLLLGIQGDVPNQAIAAPSPTPSAAGPSGPSNCGQSKQILLDEVAQNISFKNTCLVAPAGRDFSINFDNTDAGTPHNIAVSKSSSYSSFIFTGTLLTGPNKTVYDVTKSSGPLAAGTYYFRCDVHPTSMFGVLAVVKSSGR